MKKLQEYREKRNFSVTPEPKGGRIGGKGELRYCIQHHAARTDHFDLRLEYGGVALSWAVPKGPSFDPKDKRLAVRVEDHPVEYMEFEGTIPKGEYGGGEVMLFDEGTWTPRTDPGKGLKEGSLKFTIHGERLKGDWALVRMKGTEERDMWLFIKERDAFAKTGAGISRFRRGVRSGKTMKEIGEADRKNPFSAAEVMLPVLTDKLPRGTGWQYELKYDGHRTLAFSQGGKTVLKTRNGRDCTSAYPAAAEAVSAMLAGEAAVLDGEMIVTRDGLSDFGALQAYSPEKGGLSYVLFDLLAFGGRDLRGLPLSERREKLNTLMKNAPAVLSFSRHTSRITRAQLETLKARGIEGIVMKRADSAYMAGKREEWRKLKFRKTEEFVIGGYLEGEDGGLSSLLVGRHEGSELRYMGKVGTGLSEETKRELMKSRIAGKCPFTPTPKLSGAVWTKPNKIAQVEYAEITSTGKLRQASFKGLRQDKSPKEVTAEKKSAEEDAQRVCGVVITHPEKEMFSSPKVTKLALAEYYAAVAPRMLPYLRERRLSLVCCPSGVSGEKFFRKHPEGELAGVERTVDTDGFLVKSARGLVSLAQYNAVEFHVPAGKEGKLPDVMVFDLDPDEALPLAEVRKGARALDKVLGGLGLVSFLKTSGGKGYHIVVPFREGAEEERFRDFARQVALLMERAYPKLFTSNVSKRERTGKIYLDWQRNSRGATSAAPYSVRAREGAPVSMPIAWEELGRVAPASVTLSKALKRVEKPDPWKDFFAVKAKQRLRFLPEERN